MPRKVRKCLIIREINILARKYHILRPYHFERVFSYQDAYDMVWSDVLRAVCGTVID